MVQLSATSRCCEPALRAHCENSSSTAATLTASRSQRSFQDLLATRETREAFLECVQRLGAEARAAGIHLVLATQHPDRKTVPAAIKVNMTGKIALKVHQAVDSLVVLGTRGAEKLLGHGDLYADLGRGIVRAQGALP